MYTKTATAVVLALLGAAKAADVTETVTKDNYVEVGVVKKFACTAGTYNPQLMQTMGNGAAPQVEPTVVPGGPFPTDFDCFSAAASESSGDATTNYCVTYTPKTDDAAATCTAHKAWGLACDESDHTSVYMKGGKYQDDAEVREAACTAKVGEPVARTCRCQPGRWLTTMEGEDS